MTEGLKEIRSEEIPNGPEMGSALWNRHWKVVAGGGMTWQEVMAGAVDSLEFARRRVSQLEFELAQASGTLTEEQLALTGLGSSRTN